MTGAARLWERKSRNALQARKANKTGLKSDLKGDRGVELTISVNHARICATRRVLDAVFARLPELPPPTGTVSPQVFPGHGPAAVPS